MNNLKLEILKMLLHGDTDSSQSVDTEKSPFLNQNVVVRTYSAGVHVGRLLSKSGTNVLLEDSYRLYNWEGAFTLSAVATKGITGGKVATPVKIEITQAIELIPITDSAFESIKKHIHNV